MNIISSTKSVNAANRSVVDSPTCFWWIKPALMITNAKENMMP